jgi:DNA-binding GntR family transcriptional regulator
MQEHLNLIEAFKLRDPQRVAQTLAHHIDSAHQRVLGQDRRVLGSDAAPLTSFFSS